MKLLAAPASLKGVLSPIEAAALLAAGMRRGDGGRGTEAPGADGGGGAASVDHTPPARERRLAVLDELAAYRALPGAGAGGGLGAAFAAMGAELVDGAELVLDVIRFDEDAQGAALVVTGEGTVDATTFEGKAPGAVLRRCEALGVRCELFGGIVREGFAAHALSGRRALAGEDLVQLGEELALRFDLA